MTEKRFKLKEDCDWWGITDNKLPKTENGYREDLSDEYLSCDYCWNDLTHQEVVNLLNNQDMQIFLLKCVIQTITAESMDKNISHKRILEIKKYWYDKLYGDDE